MRSKGSHFTLGVWGLRVCLLDVAFTVATVRNRSQPSAWGPYGRAYGKFCRGGHFWRFQTSRCFVSRGRRGTSWHSDVFCNESRFLCGRRNTFATFSEDVLHFSWQAQHFGRVHRRGTLDVSCCVFFVNRIGRAASSGDKVQIPWQAWHFARCAEKWRRPRTKHRFWGAKFHRWCFRETLLRISRSKAWFLNSVLEKYSKCRDQIRAPKNQISEWPCLHYITQHYATLITSNYITLHIITLQLQLQLRLQLQLPLHDTTVHYTHYITLHYNYTTLHYTRLHYTIPNYSTQHYSTLHHTNYTTPTTNLSYRFPIFEASATALRGTTGSLT